MATFTIIIPFYQKQSGILNRAFTSIFEQTFQDFDILVVDDESPVSVDGDLKSLTEAQRSRIKVIRQKNAGPGGARNTGLDNIPASTRYAAFLDSDDIWTPNHLQNAYDGLTRFEADCYFASIDGGEEFYYHSSTAELANSAGVVRLSETPLLMEVPDMESALLKSWGSSDVFLHLSSMAIGRGLFEKIRFEAELRLAAEDMLFFCDCLMAAKRVLVCGEQGASRGMGVNIFHGIDNDSPQFLKQQFTTWAALNLLESKFSHRPDDVASIRDYKNTVRRTALWSQARQIKHRKMPQLGLLARWAWRDPGLLKSAAQLAVGKLCGFARKRASAD
ncbi:glycosyltransferase family 2 protein [Rhizobium sp. BK251]|uniref:glycosyltransferase family 2 protein n=1 Tax=Rhizobium sp. BK251 TaxID=2512125 RepID=UPI00104635B2|nr:glycosyltransferase family 2 protein [Rhizobium sp. BK251]TCL70324.1 succinoglycan biosynthesis protein ExoW [Rhizobium sp. BK251]